jgi:hypothetical protein
MGASNELHLELRQPHRISRGPGSAVDQRGPHAVHAP